MPINPQIPLSVNPGINLPAIHQAANQVQEGQARNKLLELQMQYAQEDRPMQQRAAEVDIKKAELGVADISDLTQAEDARRLITLGDRDGAIAALRADGPDDRVGNQLADMLEAGDAEQVIGALDELQVELRRRLNQGAGAGKLQFGTGTRGKATTSSGRTVYGSQEIVRDPATGESRPQFVPFSPLQEGEAIQDFVPVGTLGMTGAEQIKMQTDAANQRTQFGEEVKTEEQAKRERQKAQETRLQGHIDRAFPAADSTAVLRRGLSLLEEIDTGGFAQVALKAKNQFGFESADEGELASNLGKAVLSQLRETFGAQFTEREGARLQAIEAGLGKSTETNKRLLEQALRMMERIARRGIKSAEDAGDFDSAEELEDALEFSLDPLPNEQQGLSKPPAEMTDEEIKRALNGI